MTYFDPKSLVYKIIVRHIINRGNNMIAQRYEFSPQVLNNISRASVAKMSEIFFNTRRENFVSPSRHVIFCLLYKHQ